MQADRQILYEHVDFLTSIYPFRNYKNVESLQKAADYIYGHFAETSLSIARQTWKAGDHYYQNIIASYRPEIRKRFIVGAHYDVYKDIPGADDNASAVAGLLEIARAISLKSHIPYGIDLVAFNLEEPPFFKTKQMGSYMHAASLADQDVDVIGMLSLEMIGYYGPKEKPNDRNNYLIVSGIKKYDDFNKKISKLLRMNSVMESRRISYADDFLNNGPSDHLNYWPYDIPAAMIIGTDGGRNPHYHKPTDTIDTLDFEILTQAVNSIIFAVSNFHPL